MGDPMVASALIGGGSSMLTSLMNNLFNWGANQKTMEREDTAIQRRVADLKAAGLSPVLAAGSPAAAQPIRPGMVSDPVEAGYAAMRSSANIAQSAAEKERLQVQRMRDLLEMQEKAYNLEWFQKKNWPTTMGFDPMVRAGTVLQGAGKEALQNLKDVLTTPEPSEWKGKDNLLQRIWKGAHELGEKGHEWIESWGKRRRK